MNTITGEKSELARACAARLLTQIQDHPSRNTLLLLSGGSAFVVYDALDTLLKQQELSLIHLHITMLDERYDEKNSNFLTFMRTPLYNTLIGKGAHVFGMMNYTKPMEESAKEFNNTLMGYTQEKTYVAGVLGMGADGHTAGIVPYPEDKDFFEKTFNNPHIFAVSYNAHEKNPFSQRITVTLPFIRKVDFGVAYVVGSGKQQKLEEALFSQSDLASLPFGIVHELKDITLFTDIPIRNA